MKHCPSCHKTLELFNFTKNKRRKDGLNVYCTSCCKLKRDSKKEEYNKKRNEKWKSSPEYREKYLAYHKNRYIEQKVDLKVKAIEYYSKPEISVNTRLKVIEKRCRENGIPFSISVEDITLSESCKYLGIPLTYERGLGRLDNSASIDRVIPELGYVKGNVEIISDKANRMKNNASKEELITFAKSILKEYKNEV